MTLEVRQLYGGYGPLQVLNGVDVTVQDGEVVALLGANGAGKSTLLRLVSGMLKPTRGTVELDGRGLSGLRTEKVAAAGLVHVPENRLVFPGLTVLDNLELGAWLVRRQRSTRADVERVFALFPRLRERTGQLAGTLSGGEQQMLAIGRGLMARPRLLVLDEPSLGLAPRVVGEIFQVLSRIRDTDGIGMLLVEQNVRAAFKIADRGHVIDRGRIVKTGDVAELRDDPSVQRAYLGVKPEEADAGQPRGEG